MPTTQNQISTKNLVDYIAYQLYLNDVNSLKIHTDLKSLSTLNITDFINIQPKIYYKTAQNILRKQKLLQLKTQ